MVVAISSEAEVIAPLSMDRFNQERAIAALDPWSTTALHDAIIATLDRLEPRLAVRPWWCFRTGPTATAARPPPR